MRCTFLVCAQKSKDLVIKMYGFWIIKGLVCLFLLFWYCVTISCLSTFDLYCLLDLFVLSLFLWSCISLDLSYLGMNPGHLFHTLNQLLLSMIAFICLFWGKHNAARLL